ncbi:MAG: universal stress protein [Gammaproteobacteria bacterium]
MTKTDTMLIVVDPTAENHPAIERGMILARRCGFRAELFICGYRPQLFGAQIAEPGGRDATKHDYLNEQRRILESLAEPFAADGIDVTVKTAWDHPLYEGIIREALRSDPRLVVTDTHYQSRLRRTLFTNTDWHLIRSCPAPLWLARSGPAFDAPVMLASVDPMHEHDKPAALDTRLLAEAFEFAGALGGTVHAFHAYNPFRVPDDPKHIESAHEAAVQNLADSFQIPDERVHIYAGSAIDLLPQLATEISADLVVMGAVSRSRLEYAIVGSTAENVLDQLPCDALIVKPKGFISPVTFKSAPSGVVYADAMG